MVIPRDIIDVLGFSSFPQVFKAGFACNNVGKCDKNEGSD